VEAARLQLNRSTGWKPRWLDELARKERTRPGRGGLRPCCTLDHGQIRVRDPRTRARARRSGSTRSPTTSGADVEHLAANRSGSADWAEMTRDAEAGIPLQARVIRNRPAGRGHLPLRRLLTRRPTAVAAKPCWASPADGEPGCCPRAAVRRVIFARPANVPATRSVSIRAHQCGGRGRHQLPRPASSGSSSTRTPR